MMTVPIYSPWDDDELEGRITKHAQQHTLGSNVKSVKVHGVQILSWANKDKEHILHNELMMVKSLYPKTVVNESGISSFKGRLFYAIIPNSRSKTVTFYFSNANTEETRSVACGLPLFIKDQFKLNQTYFCLSDAVDKALARELNFEKRCFLTLEEREEKEKFAHLVKTMAATKESFISVSHQKAFAMEGYETEESVEVKLVKGDNTLPKIAANYLSALTSETRESKAKAYAATATMEVVSQYMATITDLTNKHEYTVDSLQAWLDEGVLDFP